VTEVSLFILPASGLLLAAAVMSVVWAGSMTVRNASFVDVAWAFLFSLLAWQYLWITGHDGPRQLLLAAMTTGWSIRLAWHLLVRVVADHPREDSRYAQLRRDWHGTAIAARFFWFFQLQAVAAVLLSAPVIAVALDPATVVGPMQLSGAALWLIGVIGEAVADRQLARFRARPDSRGEVCREGLWRYSRHPNYFFEWVVWCGFGLYAAGSPGGWLALYAPVLMLIILLKVTGVPTSEAASLRSRGEKYRAYQRTTSSFVPWFPRPA
jgi:steroid 5-alpha reductase family enzyme